MHSHRTTRRATRSLRPALSAALLLLALLLALGQPRAALAAGANLNLTLSTAFPIVDSGAWSVVNLSYSCSSVTNSPCENATVTAALPPELAGGAGDVQALGSGTTPAYSPATRTVTWTFSQAIAAGDAGILELRVRFPAGSTPDGTTATLRAEMRSTSAPPRLSNPLTLTARAEPRAFAEKTLLSGGAPDVPTTYQLEVCIPAGGAGSLNLGNVLITDTIPPGSTFISASDGGALSGGAVTWPPTALSVPGNLCATRTVVVRFPDAGFNIGDQIRNDLSVSAQAGGATLLLGDSDVRLLQPPTPGYLFSKQGPSSALVGDLITYTLGVNNTGTTALDDVVLTDPIPPELEVTRITAGGHNLAATVRLALEYTTSLTPTFTAAPGGPFTAGSCVNVAPATGGGCAQTLTLAPGERVTAVRWRYLDPLPFGFAATGHALQARVISTPVNAIIVNRASSSYSYNGVSATRIGEARTRVVAPGARATIDKSVDPAVVYAGGTVSYTVSLENVAVGSPAAALDSPVLADLLVPSLSYLPGSSVVIDKPSGAPDPALEVIDNYNAGGRTLLRWSWPGYSLPAGEALTLRFQAQVRPSTLAGSIANTAALASFANPPGEIALSACGGQGSDSLDLDGDGNTSETICSSSISSVALAQAANTSSLKLVLGQLDSAWTRDPLTGLTTPGGMADYQLWITNTNTVALTDLALIDILPWEGDVGVVRSGDARGSQWRPYLIGPISAPAGATVYYSTTSNPCRNPELGLTGSDGQPLDAPGCVDPAWSSVPPADITTVGSVKIDFGGLVLQPQDALLVTWPMRAPLGGAPGEIAWNTFGYRARDLAGNYLPAAEPPRVGIERGPILPPAYGDYVWLDGDLDGVQDAGEPGVNGARVDLYEDSDGSGGPSAGDRFVAFTVAGPDDAGMPGFYLFSDPADFPPGDYYTVVVPPPGYGLTAVDAGADDTADSDVDPATRVTAVTSLGSGELDLSWDIGLITDTAVGNYVWIDRNANGLQDEPASDGVNGVTVRLYDPGGDGQPGGGDDSLLGSATTADDPFGQPGYYLFAGLAPGRFFVEFALPAGFAFSGADAAADAVDSDAGAGGRTAAFDLAARQLDATRDAGLTLATGSLALGDRVWRDADDDGRYEPLAGERGIDGVRLSLYLDVNGNGQPDAGEYVAGTTTRTVFGAPGYYQFASLAAGNYLVALDPGAFAAGGPLAGLRTSTGNDPAPDPDDNRDHDDNGELLGGLVRARAITLSAGGEPGAAVDGDGSSGNQTLDFGLVSGAALGDRVWFDSDGDGLQGAGEPGVPGVTVELLDGATTLGSAITDGAGRYGFTGLSAGDYRLRFGGLPVSHTLTISGTGTALDSDPDPLSGVTPLITLADGASDLSWDAGLVAAPAALGDLVWDDQDRDGLQDAGEPGLPGVVARLFRPGPDGAAGTGDDELVATDTTDATGRYGFAGLPPGAYFVEFSTLPAGYAVSPTDSGDDTADSDADRTTRRTDLTTLSPGEDDPSWDLGLYTFASLGDRVWRDGDNNGVQDAGEPGVANVRVRLYQPGSGAAVASTTTDASGAYSFSDLIPGDYYLEFSLPTGYRAAAPDQIGDEARDSDPNQTTYQTVATSLDPGESDMSWDFGIFPSAGIGDRAWLDADADGVQDAGESAGVPGVQVVLLDALGDELDTTVSDATGLYRFDGLIPGSYSLRFILPPSYLLSPQDQGGDDAADSDVPAGLATSLTALVAGESDMSWDIGLYQPSSLGDLVWHDIDGDGLQDGDEPGVANVPVSLYRPGADGQPGGGDDNLLEDTTTDTGGRYSFGNLAPGPYFVQFGATPGFSLLSPRDSAAAGDATDSDVDAGRRTPVVSLPSSSADLSLDMGVLNPASLGNYVWFDADVDGLQDAGEAGVPGVTVTLYTGAGSAVATDTTDLDGLYLFTGLAPGEYYLVFSDLPADRSFTRRDQGADDGADSDATQGVAYTYDGSGRVIGSAIVGTTGLTRLVSGSNDLSRDAGIYATIRLGDRVWLDSDADGVQDAGETAGVPGMRVELLRDGDGALLDYTYSDGDGLYLFSDLLPGAYRIRFGELPAGYLRSPQGRGGDPALDSDADAALTTAPVSPAAGSDLRYDLGLYQPASIGDMVWEDQDGDGVQDAGEPGIGGVTVTLSGSDGAGGAVSLSATTSPTGAYSFDGLMPGAYTVTVAMPAGYRLSASDRGGDDALDSDADPATGAMATTDLTSGERDLSWDAGLYRPASIGDVVWRDADGDGVQGAGEPGVGGVAVSLGGTDGAGGAVSLSATTDGDGLYGFTSLAPGVYTVTVTAPAGEIFTYRDIIGAEVAGASDASDSDADPATGAMAATTLASGESDQSWDAGLVVPAALGDRVWEDLDGDGEQEAGEPGMGGVTVTLTGAGRDRSFGTADDTTASDTTDTAGAYGFAGLQPGLYRVTFARPAGYAFTAGDAASATDAADSDVAGGIAASRSTVTVDLASGESDQSWDAGLYQLLSLGSRVWEDRNNDGADASESGLDGLTVRLYRDLNGDGDLLDAGEAAAVGATTTASGGYYLFKDLEQGDYLVEVTHTTAYVSSSGTNGSATGTYEPGPDVDGSATDKDDNGTKATTTTTRSALVTLTPGGEPLAESDPLPGALVDPARDENSNLSVDFGLYRPASIGDLVWLDRDADGVQDGGDETGLGAVSVELYLDDDGATGPSAGDTRVLTATTAATGAYAFDNLRPGDYYLSFALPATYVRSPADQGADTGDSDADRAAGLTIVTALDPGESEQTWDAGLYQRVNLGDLVWDDANNNGALNAGEPGLDGVTVNLYRDQNGDGDVLDGAETTAISTTTTAGGGLYGFANLDPGSYVVELPASNFSGAGALAGSASLPAYRSSTGAVGSPTGPNEGALTPDPDVTSNTDDNGTTDGGGNVRALAVTLRTQDEPLAGVDGDGGNGNLSVDFGLFRPLALGDRVWNDLNNNRAIDGGEPGRDGVTVQLYNGAATQLISTTTTLGGGLYRFDNLVAGDYLVRIPAANFAGAGALRFFRSSDGGSATDTAPDPDLDSSNADDNGAGPGGAMPTGDVDSAAVTLTVGGEPADDGDASSATNLSVDFGFYSLTVGNRVWNDLNNNGLLDGAEVGRDGVTVSLLYDADGNGTIVGGETTAVITTTTSAGGRYLFGALRHGGSYAVQITLPGGYVSSTGGNGLTSGPYEGGATPDPDSPAAIDGDDNGTGSPLRTLTFIMSAGTEPTGEGDTATGATNPAADDSSDLSVDFGIFDDARLGNRVWLDADGDGIQDTGETTNIAGVRVTIYDAATGQPLDGDPSLAGTQPLSTTTTAAGTGNYAFTRLLSGTYHLVFNNLPAQYAVSPKDAAGDTADSDASLPGMQTATITLTNNTDNNWDLGLYPRLTLGNLVWYDADDDGQKGAAESGIPGVVVELYPDLNGDGDADDLGETAALSTTTTAATGAVGSYSFAGLAQGSYVVAIPASEFAAGGPLHRHRSSTGSNGAAGGSFEPAPDPDSDADDDDNGSGAPDGGVRGLAITLNPSAEPAGDGDDTNGNQTLDFGFFEPLSLGDLVWEDTNNNGRLDGPAEQGLAGVLVELFLDADGDGAAGPGEYVAAATTDADGLYAFRDLIEGSYIVRLPAGQFGAGQPLAGFVSSTGANGAATGPFEGAATPSPDTSSDDGDDNGTTVDGNVVSLPIALSRGGEPLSDGDGSNGNQTLDFGLFRPARMGDQVWEDTNANGLQDSGEPGVAGATVRLYASGGALISTTTTLAGGLYSFDGLIPGDYYLGFDLPAGYSGVSAADRGDDALDSDADPLTRQTPLTALVAGESDPSWDVGLYNPASIGNLVWSDTDGDGVQAPGEPGVAGVTVTLSGVDGQGAPVSRTTSTDGDGRYGFAGLLPGTYTITVEAPAGQLFTHRDISGAEVASATDATDSDADPATGAMLATNLISGEDDSSWDAGLVVPVALGDLVWHDLDADGAQDGDEPGVAGVTVTLSGAGRDRSLGSGDDTSATTTTDGAGLYEFGGLLPGSYTVTVTAPGGFQITARDASGDAVDSDADPATGAMDTTTLSSGDSDQSWDAGLFRPVSLGDLVFEDFADDGVFDAGDQPIAGAQIGLYAADGLTPASDLSGATVLTQTTGADGLYRFGNLRPGVYVVRAAGPAGYASSTDLASAASPDGDLDGDDNGLGAGATAASGALTLTSGGEPLDDGDENSDSNLSVDFGFFRPAAIGDLVWLDASRDGAQDAGEPGVPGVTVELWRDGGTTALMTTTTGPEGDYRFERLPRGDYFVRFVLPRDFERSPAGGGDPAASDAGDSDADPATGETAITTLDPGEEDLTWDSGLFYAAGLGNRVWLDRDANGVQDAGELGVEGVRVRLFVRTEVFVAETTTDADGFYGFPYLPPDDYLLSFELPEGYSFSPQLGSANPDADSDVDPESGTTGRISLANGAYDSSWDAGLYRLVSLGDLVWEDTDNDGILDGDERGLAGVPVHLFADADADGAPDGAAPVATTTTDLDGRYSFAELLPGRYIVAIEPPAGYRSSTGALAASTGAYEPAPGPDGDLDGDDNGSAAGELVRSGAVTLWSQDEPDEGEDGDGRDGNLSVDFGLFRPAGLGSTVWFDRDGDGRQGEGEPGVAGVTVTLYHDDGAPARDAAGRPISATTDAAGHFSFGNLTPGAYMVGFSGLPAGYTFTSPGVGDDAGDSDADPVTGMTVAVTLGAGDQDPSLWAGLINPTAVSLVGFTAERRGEGVALRWETGAEWDAWGFHILRSADGTRAGAVRITPAIILARGGPQQGAVYGWLDAEAAPGVRYSYWLEEHELGGATNEYGPATPRGGTSGGPARVFLPIVVR